MKSGALKVLLIVVLISAVAGLGIKIYARLQDRDVSTPGTKKEKAIPVETADIEYKEIALTRVFSGELKAGAEFIVAPKISGRVERIYVNISDPVKRGQIVAELDNDEYVQEIAGAKAELEVTKANLAEAKSALEIVKKEYQRTAALLKRGIASASEFDASKQNLSANEARVHVAEAEVEKAAALLKTANIKLGYTKVIAGWNGDDDHRIVAARYVDEGHTVAANAPLLTIVKLNPVTALIYVTEKDYVHMEQGRTVTILTAAYPGETFTGYVERIAPVFSKTTRQAGIEISVPNKDGRLKPGMFIRAAVEMMRSEKAVVVPTVALTQRNDKEGVFIVNPGGKTVSWREVKVGIRQNGSVEILLDEIENKDGFKGKVVTLGQQLLKDGSSIIIPDFMKKTSAKAKKEAS